MLKGKQQYGRNDDGSWSVCKAKPENVGRYNCHHAEHQILSSTEAQTRNERAYEKAYVLKSNSLKAAMRYARRHEDWVDKDPEVRGLISNALAGKRFATFKTSENATTMPAKTVRQSRATRELTNGMVNRFKSVRAAMEGLSEPARMSAMYASANSMESDMKRLKKSVADEALGDVLYTNGSNVPSGFTIQSSAVVDVDALKSDLNLPDDEAWEIDGLYETTDMGYSTAKIKTAFMDSLSDSIPKGTKGAPALRKKAWEDSGLASDEISYVPDSKTFANVRAEHSDAVISERFDDDTLSSMSGAAKRAALCELTVEHQSLKDDISKSESSMTPDQFRSAAESPRDGLKYKEVHRSVLNEDKVKAWAKERGLKDGDLRKSVTNVSLDRFKEFAKRKNIPSFKYLNPRHSVHIRVLDDQRSYDGHVGVKI